MSDLHPAPNPPAPISARPDHVVPPAAAETLDPAEFAAVLGTPLKPGPLDVLPAEFGRHRVERLLGGGAMGRVYLARDTQLDRPVALKVPTFNRGVPQTVIRRFRREARSSATLRHPNICPVYDVGEIDGTHFLTMGFVEGRPLSELLVGGAPLPERQAATIARKLALRQAHEKGVIHRDVKPANVMIDRKGEPVLTDFGLARSFLEPDEARLTTPGMTMGSPAYMSPEQIRGQADLGPGTDVYSLGVVLYECVTGRLPFAGDPMTVAHQVLGSEPPPPGDLRPDLSPALATIVMKAMAKSPVDRYASAADFAAALTAFLKEMAAAANAKAARAQTVPMPKRPARPPVAGPSASVFTPALLGFGGVALAVTALVVGVALGRRGGDAKKPTAVSTDVAGPTTPGPPTEDRSVAAPDLPSGVSTEPPAASSERRDGPRDFNDPQGFDDLQGFGGPESGGPMLRPDDLNRPFALLDSNGDDRIDRADGYPPHIIMRGDKNGDRALSRAEFDAAVREQGEAFFGPRDGERSGPPELDGWGPPDEFGPPEGVGLPRGEPSSPNRGPTAPNPTGAPSAGPKF